MSRAWQIGIPVHSQRAADNSVESEEIHCKIQWDVLWYWRPELKAEAVVIAQGKILTDILEAQLAAAEHKKPVLIIAERLEVRGKNKRVSGHKKRWEKKG